MKKLIFFLFPVFFSCNSITTTKSLEGSYTCQFEHEFAKTEDTLLVKKINENYYQIVRHSGVIKKMDGKESSKEVIVENWKLEFDKNKNILTETKTGKTLIWNPEKQLLIFGNRDYSRVSN